MRTLTHLAFTTLLLLLGTGLAAQDLAVRLSAPRAVLDASEAVELRFELANNGRHALDVLRWHTPLAGVDDDLFEVERDGQPVLYTGRHVKRPAPSARDFVRLAPGQSVSVELELSAVYDMARPGSYTVRYRAALAQLVPALGDLRGGAPAADVESNAAALTIEGVDEGPSAEEQALARALEEFNAGPTPDAVTPVYRNCSNSRRTALATALGSAENYAIQSHNYLVNLPTTQRPTNTRYKTWFGAYTSSRYGTVQGHFSSIRSALSTKTMTFNCACTDDYYAYVYPNRPYEIFLCNAFWTAPNTGRDSRAGTLVHEVSHFNVVAGTDDWAYGHSACKSLAINNPNRAVDNADSHEYFAENTN